MLDIARKAADRVVADFLGKGPRIRLATRRSRSPCCGCTRSQITGHISKWRASSSSSVDEDPNQYLLFPSYASLDRWHHAEHSFASNGRSTFSLHPGYSPNKLPPNNFAKSAPNSTLRWLFSSLTGKYLQQHTPIRKQTVPVGHSVRFGYLETARPCSSHRRGQVSPPSQWKRPGNGW